MVAVYNYRYFLAIIIIFQTVFGFSVESDKGKWQSVKDGRSLEDEDDTNGLGYGMMRNFLNTWNDCLEEGNDVSNSTMTCQSVRIVRKVIAQLLDGQRSLEISKGLKIVKVEESNAVGRGLTDHEESNLLARMSRYLQSHELRVRLPELLPSSEDWNRILEGIDKEREGSSCGRKNKGGMGLVMAMGGMMWSMMTMAGMGALGLVAMKALALASMALVLAGVAAIKKLTSKDDDGGHHVSVVPVHHGGEYGHGHRRKREDSAYQLPYRGYYRQ
ncbi:uncharacterized protein Osi5 [Anabrus simplex]|uniref:uncharacterized protein Osi5 n=1 Tax=Anabrus simplex TaxID=316456 RepID=UPI0035A3CB62